MAFRQLPNFFGEQLTIESYDLGSVRNGVLGKTRGTSRKKYVAGSFHQAKIASQGNADNGSYAATVKRVSLDN
jgi:hypothetical protein